MVRIFLSRDISASPKRFLKLHMAQRAFISIYARGTAKKKIQP